MPDASIDAARAKVYNEVFVPVFFHKLAQAGISPANAGEAESLLRFGQAAFHLDRREAGRRASARGDAFAKAAAMIEAEAVAASPRSAAAADAMAKSAADALLADPAIAAAVAALVASA